MSNEPKPVTAEKLYDDLNSWIGGKMPRHFVISKIREALGSCAAAARKQALDEAMSFYPYGATQAAVKSKSAASETEENGMLLPEFPQYPWSLRLYNPQDEIGWVCHFWPAHFDVKQQTYGEGETPRAAVLAAIAKVSP